MTKSGGSGREGGRALKVRVRTARKRSLASTLWLERQLNDPYVAQARREGYRSRAAFKLAEIDDKFHILKKDARVVDLGAAPGGWSEIAARRIGAGGKVITPPRGAPDALLAHRRDPDRRSGLLHGRRRHVHIGEVVIFAAMAEFLACKASLDDGQPFEHTAEALAEWHTEGVKFLDRRPDPDRQIDAPA